MEPKFRTETILDLPVYREFQRSYAYSNKLTIFSRIVCSLALIYYILHFDNPILLYGFLIVGAVSLITHLIQNRKNGNIAYKRMLAANKGKPNHSVYEIRENEIFDTNRDNGNTFTYPYEQIRYLINTPRLILVVLQYRMCVILQKDWLTGGTPEELTAYILERCPHIRRKKVRQITLGKWANRVLTLILIVGCVIALLRIPAFPILDKLSGRLGNDLSYQEMAAELEPLGITISDRTITELEEYDADYLAEWGIEYYRGNRDASKFQDLLYWEGSGEYDQETWEWTPSTSGIYWMDTEVWNAGAIYTDFFTGLDAMSDEITVTNIREDYSATNEETGTGIVSVYFDLNGTRRALDACYDYDWFDICFLQDLGRLFESDKDPLDLYAAYDGGQGLYFVYCSAEDARQLSRLSGLTFRKASQVQFYS